MHQEDKDKIEITKRRENERRNKKTIKQLSDSKYKEFHSNLCPGTDNILGVRVPVLRNYAKELVKKYPVEKLLKKHR